MEQEELKKLDRKPLRDAKGRLLPGQLSINPAGRPKGKTIKERVRQWLEDHPEDMEAFVQHFVKRNRELGWQMLEGSPKSATDLTSGGRPIPIMQIHGVPTNNGDEEDSGDAQTDTDSAGWDGGQQDGEHPALLDSEGAA